MSWNLVARPAFALAIVGLRCSVLQAASIEGSLIQEGTGVPVAGATVDLHYSMSRATLQMTATDNTGRFHFAVREAGEYGIDVSAPGYLPYSKVSEHGLRIDETMIENETGASMGTLKLSRAAAIFGEVRDATSDEPIGDLTVIALRARWWHGQRLFDEARIGFTDGRGAFRLEELPPGEYVLEIKHAPLPQIETSREADRPRARGEASRYPLFFWPDAGEGGVPPVALGPGQEVNLGKIPAAKIESTRVHGQFDGPSCSGEGTYQLIVMQQLGGTLRPRYDVLERPCDSAFNIPFLSPGQYQVQAWPRRLNLNGPTFAAEEFHVRAGDDLELNLKAEGGVVLAGKVVCECDVFSRGLTVSLRSAHEGPHAYRSTADVREDGTFVSQIGFFGLAILDIGPLPDGLFVRSIVYNGQPALRDSVLMDLHTDHQEIAITLSDKIAELHGATVRDGNPLSEAHIIIAPSPIKLIRNWPESLLVRADAMGSFQVRGLGPGDYQLVALSPAEWEEAQLPGMLAAKVAAGARVTIEAAEIKSIVLH